MTGVDDDWLPGTSKLQPEGYGTAATPYQVGVGLGVCHSLTGQRASTGSIAGWFLRAGDVSMARDVSMVRMADGRHGSMEVVGRKEAVCVGFVQYNSTYMRTCVTESADAG